MNEKQYYLVSSMINVYFPMSHAPFYEKTSFVICYVKRWEKFICVIETQINKFKDRAMANIIEYILQTINCIHIAE